MFVRVLLYHSCLHDDKSVSHPSIPRHWSKNLGRTLFAKHVGGDSPNKAKTGFDDSPCMDAEVESVTAILTSSLHSFLFYKFFGKAIKLI